MRTWTDGERAVAAVADGHGHHSHFRSDVGAALAVDIAVEELRGVMDALADVEPAVDVARGAMEAIVDRWVAAVGRHIEDEPFTDDELVRGAAYAPTRPYGTTLVTVAVAGEVMVVAQIGDGDVVLVDRGGRAVRPLPDDPRLDGVHTSSLCQADPVADLRVAALDARAEDVALAMLLTDGYGKAQQGPDWCERTGRLVAAYVEEHGVEALADELPGWLEEAALVGGDDTTMAVLRRS